MVFTEEIRSIYNTVYQEEECCLQRPSDAWILYIKKKKNTDILQDVNTKEH